MCWQVRTWCAMQGNIVGPFLFLLERVVRIALRQEVLEEAHVLEAKQGNLMMRLVPGACQACLPRLT